MKAKDGRGGALLPVGTNNFTSFIGQGHDVIVMVLGAPLKVARSWKGHVSVMDAYGRVVPCSEATIFCRACPFLALCAVHTCVPRRRSQAS